MQEAIYTAGHGSRSTEEFLEILREADINNLIDVRAFPGSRRHPQFGREALEKSLAENGISYVWEGKALGGRRKGKARIPAVAGSALLCGRPVGETDVGFATTARCGHREPRVGKG